MIIGMIDYLPLMVVVAILFGCMVGSLVSTLGEWLNTRRQQQYQQVYIHYTPHQWNERKSLCCKHLGRAWPAPRVVSPYGVRSQDKSTEQIPCQYVCIANDMPIIYVLPNPTACAHPTHGVYTTYSIYIRTAYNMRFSIAQYICIIIHKSCVISRYAVKS